jgi:DNA-binding HxlR family transcriptional regulator
MDKRSYRQFCAIARALDVVGERWTLLLVRELLAGPRRFGDLLDGLPGIGTNLLSARLRDLQSADVVEKIILPPPAASTVYQLTPRGHRLRSIVIGLGAWGDPITDAPEKGDVIRPWWALLLLNGRIYHPDTTIPRDLTEAYELHADGDVYHLAIVLGKVTMGQGPHDGASVFVKTDGETIASVLSQKTTFQRALDKGDVVVEGDPKKLRRLARILDLPLE